VRAIPLQHESGKRLAFVMHMRRSTRTLMVICATIGASVIAPSRAMAARGQQIFTIVKALDSVPPAARAASGAVPDGVVPDGVVPDGVVPGAAVTDSAPPAADRGSPFAATSSAGVMGAKARAKLDSIVAIARAQLGTRYRLGGESPRAFDCSGLVQYVMRALDFSVPRTAREQAKVGTAVPADTAQLRAGDLLLFGRKGKVTHIGIYVGNGQFVHASTKAHRVVERPLLRKPAPGILPLIGARRLIAMPTDSSTGTPAPLARQR
jgi:cell wall-associated NlpC family hydrolase